MPSTFKLIASNTLANSTTASVTFSSIPQTYTDLVMRVSGRSTVAASSDNFKVYFNSDTSTNYSNTRIYASSAAYAARSANLTRAGYSQLEAASDTANLFATAEFYIPQYTASANKQFSSISASMDIGASTYTIDTRAEYWRNTAAITSITIEILNAPNNFASDSSFYLYGIKNS